MREITARFQSRCKKCGGTIAEGSVIFYDGETKSPYHTQCRPPEEAEQPPSREQFELADRLGFREFSWLDLRILPAPIGDDIERDGGST